ncbi:MAG: ATP-binding protein [Chloroflexi bacterium]|nr:ATP-binding protein [Chloroflexota bacterium]
MAHNRLHNEIINRLEQPLDPVLFERFAVDFLCFRSHDASLNPGGSDDGMDVGIADAKGERYPGIVTTSSRVIDNLTKNLTRYKAEKGPRRKCIVVTSDALTATRIKNLHRRARKLGFVLIQVYAQHEIASYLERNPRWCKDLLGLSGYPSALSKEPPTEHKFVDRDLIAREEALAWLRAAEKDRLLVGEPGAGKTSLLYQLTKDDKQAAWFVRTRNEGEIAEAVRERDPKILMLDGAFIDEEFIRQMMRLRNHPEINGDFSLIVTCWNGEREKIEPHISGRTGYTYELRRLIQDDMVKVINAAGIKNNLWLVNEIVRQAAGLPGLAMTLSEVAMRGGEEKIQTAEELSNRILQFYTSVIEQPVRVMLAAFALGGNTGMNTDTVSEILEISPVDLHESLRGLSSGGVIAEVSKTSLDEPDRIKVRPSALRHALIRDVFFSGSGSMLPSVRDALVAETPSTKDTALELIGARARAKARHSEFPIDFLETYISQLEGKLWNEYERVLSSLPPETKESWAVSRAIWLAHRKLHVVWEEYAWLGYYEAKWATEHFTGKVSLIAPPLLRFVPDLAIPKLLDEAIGDQRDDLHSHPDHPLRRLQDWVKGAFPQTDGPVRRRADMLRGARRWLTEAKKRDVALGYRAMLFAMIPDFQSTVPDPGSGKSMRFYRDCLTEPELLELQQFWAEIMKCTKDVEVPDWHVFLTTIWEWLHPSYCHTAEAYELLHSFAKQMARDVAETAAGHIAVMHSLQGLLPELEIPMDDVVTTLYPIESHETGWREQEERWAQADSVLADTWIRCEPAEVISQLESIETKFSQSQPWPRRAPSVSRRLAEKAPNPLAWFDAMLPTTIPADVVRPFVEEAIRRDIDVWERALRVCFETQRLRDIAVLMTLTQENVPPDLHDAALDLAGQYVYQVKRLLLDYQLSKDIEFKLFKHPDRALVDKLVVAAWQRETRDIAADFRPLWEQAFIECCEDKYWLGEILKVEPALGLRWFKHRFAGDSFRLPYSLKSDIEAVLTNWSLADRKKLLDLVPNDYFDNDIITGIVGDELKLYELLLQQRDRTKSALLSPLHRTLDPVWEAFAKLAHEHGHVPEEIAEHTITRFGGITSWEGRWSEMWKQRCEEFAELRDHDDDVIRRVAEFGYPKSQNNYENYKKQEDDEDVHGRDWIPF